MILSFSKKFPWGAPTNFPRKIIDGKKIHTIRRDKTRRWKPGNDIHFATGVRTSDYDNFAMGVCSNVQSIRIFNNQIFSLSTPSIHIWLDNRKLPWDEVQDLVVNDGFNSMEEFERWFDDDFRGVLIHWKDVKPTINL